MEEVLNRLLFFIRSQVAAAPGNDRLSMAIARELESAFGGWVPPTPNVAP